MQNDGFKFQAFDEYENWRLWSTADKQWRSVLAIIAFASDNNWLSKVSKQVSLLKTPTADAELHSIEI